MRIPLRGRLPDPANFWQPARLVVFLITLPSVLIATVGILVLVFAREELDVLYGVLILCLVAAIATGIVATLFSLKRRADISALQTSFVSKVSHELRTPLTSIRMFVETLQMGRIEDPQKLQECLDVLASETDRLTRMINRLLDWARMESGRRLFELRPTRVPAVVERALDAFAPQGLVGDVRVEVEVAPDLPLVLADADALVDVVLNLLNNAYKYSGEPKRIRVRAQAGARGVTISVEDDGPGIPHHERVRIFDRFYRGAHPSVQAIEGTGLGLAMARHVVEAHKGSIHVESELGRGSTFTIQLPALPSEAREAA